MSNSPGVSVILPFYNSAPTLEKAIQSIVNQSFTNFELLLIDNGSTDHGFEIAQSWANKDDRIRLLIEDRRGVAFAANRGLSEASAKYIARMDADDYSLPERLSEQVRLLDTKREVGLVAGLVKYDGRSTNEGFVKYVDWSNMINSVDDIYRNQFVEYPIVNPTIMFGKELYQKFGGYQDGDFPEDYEFFLRLQSEGVKMMKTDSVVLQWNDLPNRLTRTDKKYTADAFFRIKTKYLLKWLEHHNSRHPEIVVWGGGKLAKKRSTYLVNEGIVIRSFIDIKRSDNPSSIYYQEVARFKDSFILSFVSNRGARDEIRSFLDRNGFRETIDYLICA